MPAIGQGANVHLLGSRGRNVVVKKVSDLHAAGQVPEPDALVSACAQQKFTVAPTKRIAYAFLSYEYRSDFGKKELDGPGIVEVAKLRIVKRE